MSKTKSFGLALMIFICSATMVFSSTSSETTAASPLYVGGSGPGNYTMIQDALENVTTNGTIHVFPGTYHERLILTAPVHLIGDNNDNTILDGNNQEYVVILEGGNCMLSGFTITHSGRVFPNAGVYIKSNGNTVSGNILTDNFYGMRLETAKRNLISSNEIYKNLRCGVYFSRSSDNTLRGNIVSIHPVNGFGLYEFSNNNTLLENVLSQNNYSGINIRESTNNRVMNNHFNGDGMGLHVPPPEYNTRVQGNVFSENRISLEEEQDSIVAIGSYYTIMLVIVFFILWIKKK
jgi:parallel beta-helix repeat protein